MRRRRLWACVGLLYGSSVACAAEDPSGTTEAGEEAFETGGDTEESGASSTEAGDGGTDAETTGSTDGEESGGSSEGTFETGETGGEEEGLCAIDFLFVVDNSVSMADNQESLLASFPGFMDTIAGTLDATTDFHVMVADTDADTRCSPAGCQDPNHWVESLCIGPENGNACSLLLDDCDTTLGAGVVRPVGSAASNQTCDTVGGQRYLVGGEDDLETFECMARVGEAGDPSERPMDAMMSAVSEVLNGPGGCNEGFLREEAILVVTFISDDSNYEDNFGPEVWKSSLVDAKGGDEDRIVVLGLVPDPPECVEGLLGGDQDKTQGEHWRAFVESFGERGSWASVCEPDYTPFLSGGDPAHRRQLQAQSRLARPHGIRKDDLRAGGADTPAN